MCGIVGLFLKDKSLENDLGQLLSDMLVVMTDRGPDSAGVAIYGSEQDGSAKITMQSANPEQDFIALEGAILKNGINGHSLTIKDTHAILNLACDDLEKAKTIIKEDFAGIRIMSSGDTIEIYKEVGLPKDVVDRFHIEKMTGTHGIGHTRMATESAVTTLGAHPFSTGPDQCLVHNGSLSNHNRLRRELMRKGLTFETQNDTEVAAAYLTDKMSEGDNLENALEASLEDLDGFFNFVVGTKKGFGVVRDPIACKPAVMAETKTYVAFGSEYRALAVLPEIGTAKIWEPEPSTVYFWEHQA